VTAPFVVQNNGHTLSADLNNQGYGGINYADTWYELLYVNAHALSEHTFAGAHTPLELHLVHKRYDSDALLIVAIPVDATTRPPLGGIPLPTGGVYSQPAGGDANFNSAVQLLLREAPPPAMMKVGVPGNEITAPDISMLLTGAQFFGYAGSTTAPPCAETATWLVRSQPVMASDTQVRYLYDSIYASTGGLGNYRSAMPLEGRDVVLLQAIQETNPGLPYTPVGVANSGSLQTDKEYRAMKWAKDALRVATASLDYVRNLDQRLHGAAQASAAALAPINLGSPAPAPAPAPATGATVSPELAAASMAAMISQAAKLAIQNATAQMAAEADANAVEVARVATKMVLEGMGESGAELTAAREAAATLGSR